MFRPHYGHPQAIDYFNKYIHSNKIVYHLNLNITFWRWEVLIIVTVNTNDFLALTRHSLCCNKKIKVPLQIYSHCVVTTFACWIRSCHQMKHAEAPPPLIPTKEADVYRPTSPEYHLRS